MLRGHPTRSERDNVVSSDDSWSSCMIISQDVGASLSCSPLRRAYSFQKYTKHQFATIHSDIFGLRLLHTINVHRLTKCRTMHRSSSANLQQDSFTIAEESTSQSQLRRLAIPTPRVNRSISPNKWVPKLVNQGDGNEQQADEEDEDTNIDVLVTSDEDKYFYPYVFLYPSSLS